MEITCFKALVSGKVQGVFFRDSTRREALRLGIVGHAINLPDGRVEVIACGYQNDIDELAQWLKSGPQWATVTDLDINPIKIDPPAGFTIG